MSDIRGLGTRLARAIASTGSGVAAGSAVALVGVWLIVGLVTGFGQQWNAVLWSISSATTLIMVFVIQHAGQRESRAMMLKLDELLRIHQQARNEMIGVEDKEPADQDDLEEHMRAQHATDTTDGRHGHAAR
jgi:low affinity Fe/Cu permease